MCQVQRNEEHERCVMSKPVTELPTAETTASPVDSSAAPALFAAAPAAVAAAVAAGVGRPASVSHAAASAAATDEQLLASQVRES